MCGFLCISKSEQFTQEQILKSLDLQSHRGPDDTKISFDHLSGVFLGFNRLSIQDLSQNASQPMKDERDEVFLVFNGEIYNFKKIKTQFKNSQIGTRTNSDTEVILDLYLNFGIEGLLKNIKGMFSILIHDKRINKIFAIRDKFGMKPLYYSFFKNSYIFSSEIKSILNLKRDNDWDYHNALNPALTCYLPPKGKTLFNNVSEIKQGNYVELDLKKNSINEFEYTNILNEVDKKKYSQISNLSKNDYISKFIEILEKSIDEHLISDSKVGILFSAGLDSSIISKLAADKKPDLNLFHFSDKKDIFNSTHYANIFSDKYKANLNIINEADINFKKEFIKMIYHYEFPNKPEGIVLNNVCEIANSKGFKSLLTGDCADELFSGYEIHKNFYLRYKSSKSFLFKLVNKLLNKTTNLDLYESTRYDPIQTDYFIQPSLQSLSEIPINLILHRGLRNNEFLSSISKYDFLNSDFETKMQAFILDNINFAMQRYLKRSDSIGMMNSVELRIPFLDYDLFNFVVNSPLKYKIQLSPLNKYDRKIILKKVAKKLGIPDKIIFRKKIGTHFNFENQLNDIINKIEFKHSSNLLKIDHSLIKNNLINSFGTESHRAKYSLISLELIGSMFLENMTQEDLYNYIN